MNNEEEITTEEKWDAVLSTKDLGTAIKRLERKRMMMEDDLKNHFHVVLDDLKPANIIKNTLHEVQESTPLKHNLLKIAVGLGAGYFSRKLIVGKSAGLVKKVLGTALQFGITQFVAKKNDGIDENDFGSQPKKKNLLKRILSI